MPPCGTPTLAGVWANITAYGGSGNDWMQGGSGDDRLFGGAGNDELRAWWGSGNDTLIRCVEF